MMGIQNSSVGRRRYLRGAGALTTMALLGNTAEASERDHRGHRHQSRGDDQHHHHGRRPDKRIVGYYPSWAGDYTPHDVPYHKLTHLNYAFLETEANGEVKLAVTGDSAPEVLAEFEAITHERQHTSFMLSIADFGSNMSAVAASADARERFARTAVEQLRRYNFDGIDIDWEYPDGSVREDDPENFTLLLEELRSKLDGAGAADGRYYELSMAAAPIPSNIDPLEVEKIADYLDFVNVMNYNFYGSWSSATNFNAPLYAPYEDPTYWQQLLTVDNAMRYWADQPISRDKLVLGTPFYGFAFENVENENRGLFQPFDGADTKSYDDIRRLKTEPHYQYHWHHEARVPWLYSEADDVFVTYDDRHSVMEKSRYVRDNDFGGMMCWELSHDPSNTLISSIHAVLGCSHRP
ncbi:Chitinase [Haladaptatus paucihalophilus DX253]|uniref:Chitinase n=1 Tax=Haladaptatus paucihalophilus DX253 TaxID=797209 RepID=E7QQI9_HALPU|nr:glycoside hydrolase family 18 protein [Haladaptatus paucihalophilus]EFW93253.1 Chitinase [Haladaptatus paucihalophilus DX253]SHK49340.1 chitinase [Haladaptatus paucihalophilus DX253]